MGQDIHLAFHPGLGMDTPHQRAASAALCALARAHGGFLAVHAHSHIPSWIRAVYAPMERTTPPIDTMGKGRGTRLGTPDPRPPPQSLDDPHHGLWDSYHTKAALHLEDMDTGQFREQPRALYHADGWALCFDGDPAQQPWNGRPNSRIKAFLLLPPTSAHESLRLQGHLPHHLATARRFLPWMAPWWDEVDRLTAAITDTIDA